jgi:hypothetical protein
MPIGPDERRQIAQFLVIADYYLELAAPAAAMLQTMGDSKRRFMDPTRITPEDRALAIIGAHLSSAAIRLASIEDVLDDAGVGDASYRECRGYFSGAARLANNDPRASTCSDWLHVMMRDNAGHAEPPTTSSNLRDVRRCERQDFLFGLSLSDAYARLCLIASAIRTRLAKNQGIVVTIVKP